MFVTSKKSNVFHYARVRYYVAMLCAPAETLNIPKLRPWSRIEGEKLPHPARLCSITLSSNTVNKAAREICSDRVSVLIKAARSIKL